MSNDLKAKILGLPMPVFLPGVKASTGWRKALDAAAALVAAEPKCKTCSDHGLLSAAPVAQAAPTAIPYTAVIAAIHAAEAENSRRGQMYPQLADEHREDRRAAATTIGTIQFFGTSCEALKGWPTFITAQPAEPQADAGEKK